MRATGRPVVADMAGSNRVAAGGVTVGRHTSTASSSGAISWRMIVDARLSMSNQELSSISRSTCSMVPARWAI
jgi:hypothetical protein